MVAINRSEHMSLRMLAFATESNCVTTRAVKKWTNAPLNFTVPREGWPTEAPPGTVEKLLVFIARANRLEELFHPFDASNEGCVRPLVYYLEQYERQGGRV